MKNRRESREAVFALLFEWSFKEECLLEDLLQSAEEARDINLGKFAEELLGKTISNIEEIDRMVEKHSEKWKINRISKVSLACLRMAMCELLYFPNIPEGATINEAVELVKKYGSDEEAAYTNGILGGFSRRNVDDEIGSVEVMSENNLHLETLEDTI